MAHHNTKIIFVIIAMFSVFGLGFVAASSGHGMFGLIDLEPHEIADEILKDLQAQVDAIEEDFDTTLELNEVEAESVCMEGECHESWDSVCESWVESNSVD